MNGAPKYLAAFFKNFIPFPSVLCFKSELVTFFWHVNLFFFLFLACIYVIKSDLTQEVEMQKTMGSITQ